jgi:hypothetical protein
VKQVATRLDVAGHHLKLDMSVMVDPADLDKRWVSLLALYLVSRMVDAAMHIE